MSKPKFQEGEKVLCFHGVLLYEAKILEVDTKEKLAKYLVHYQGWNKNWDEFVLEKRILKYNEQGLAKQKELKAANTGKKAARPSRDFKGSVAASAADSTDDTGPGTPNANSNTDSSSAVQGSEKGPKSKIPKSSKLVESTGTEGPPSESGASDTSSAVAPPEPSTSKRRRTTAPQPPKEPTVESEDSFRNKLEVRIKIPEELNVWLVDDWDLITRQRKLVSLPPPHSVDAILEEYQAVKCERASAIVKTTMAELVQGIRDYFNVMLGSQLLYKFERPQYSDLLTEHSDKTLSQLYGGPHLLRLFVRLGSMLVYTQLDEKSMQQLVNQLHDFLKWFSMNSSRFLSHQCYVISAPEYQRRAM